jgi:predicted porin
MFHVRYNFKKFGFFKIGGEYSLQSNQDPSSAKPDSAVNVTATGFSSYLEFNPPVEKLNEKVMLVARYDMFDPNNANDAASNIGFNNNTDKQTLLLLGLAYKPAKMVTLGVSYQQLGYQSPFTVKYDGSTSKSDSRFLFHAILDF